MTAAASEDGDREAQCEQQVGAQRESQCVNTHSLHQTETQEQLYSKTHHIYRAACQIMTLVRLAAFSRERFRLKVLKQHRQTVFEAPEAVV